MRLKIDEWAVFVWTARPYLPEAVYSNSTLQKV